MRTVAGLLLSIVDWWVGTLLTLAADDVTTVLAGLAMVAC